MVHPRSGETGETVSTGNFSGTALRIIPVCGESAKRLLKHEMAQDHPHVSREHYAALVAVMSNSGSSLPMCGERAFANPFRTHNDGSSLPMSGEIEPANGGSSPRAGETCSYLTSASLKSDHPHVSGEKKRGAGG